MNIKTLTDRLHTVTREILQTDEPGICSYLAISAAHVLGERYSWHLGSLEITTGAGTYELGSDVESMQQDENGFIVGSFHYFVQSNDGWTYDPSSRLYPEYCERAGVAYVGRPVIDPLFSASPARWIKLRANPAATAAMHTRIKGTTFERTCRAIADAVRS